MIKLDYEQNYLQLIHNIFENAAGEVNKEANNDKDEKKALILVFI